MLTKRNTIICDECGLFCRPFDEYTHFGCQGPECLEPLDPLHICKKCFPKVKKRWIEEFKKARKKTKYIFMGDYQKSRAEMEVAEECGLKWIGSSGIGILGTKGFADAYQYISKKEFKRLEKLPYWGYCKVCGAENKGGYCSNNKCEKSFKKINYE